MPTSLLATESSDNMTTTPTTPIAEVLTTQPPTTNIASEWPSERCLALIKAYEEHDNLWDPNHGHYYDRAMKNQAWLEIAQELNATQYEVKKKLESLTASFRREKNKERKSRESGSRPYRSDWFAYKAFAFLLNRDDPKTSASSAESGDTYYDGSDQRKRKMNDNLAFESAKRFINSSQEVAHEDIEIQNVCGVWQQPAEEDDSTTLFTKYLGKKLNQFDQKTRAMLVHKINQLIFEAEMNSYDNE